MNRNLRNAKIDKYIQILKEHCHKDYVPLKSLEGTVWDDDKDSMTARKIPSIMQGGSFGGARKNFLIEGEFEAHQKKDCDTVLVLELGKSRSLEALAFLYGPEAIVYIDGNPVAGMDPNHSRLILDTKYLDGKKHELVLEGWTGIKEELYEIGKIGISYRVSKINQFLELCTLCFETVKMTRDEHLYQLLMDSLRKLDLYEPLGKAFEDSVQEAHEYLKVRLLDQKEFPKESAALCGHGHLDLAWLWRTCQAKKKGARTFLNVLRIMDRHEGFHFSQTQAQLFKWIEEEYPEIFAELKEKVRNGQWEILGGMWVEPDCNITGAESLVRQFLLFDRYMKERFETPGSPVVWLPDTFGFCGQLPQIMKEAGYKYFATAKLTWNQYNKMPSEYFRWEGIDGTQVLAHIVSISKPGWWGATYSADMTPKELISTVESMEKKELHDEFLMAYGMGDGGGGPTEEMAYRAELLKETLIPGLPSVRYATFADFFDNLEKKSAGQLPIWNGELYFELHRGTYTSQARVKRDNRKCETALHLAEFVAAFAAMETDYNYPGEKFRNLWEIVCLNQFHDILPGSSIQEVYQDARDEHTKVLKMCEEITEEAVNALKRRMPEKTRAVIMNSTSFIQNGIVKLPFEIEASQCLRTEETVWDSVSADGSTYINVKDVPAYGFITLSVEERTEKTRKTKEVFVGKRTELPEEYETAEQTEWILFNSLVWVEMDKNGEIVKFFDRGKKRDISKDGCKFLQWQLYEDYPADWDAWDLDEDYDKKTFRTAELVSVEIFLIPGMRAGICMKKSIGKSFITQNIYIDVDSKNLTTEVSLDYQESHQLLRLNCPVEIHNSHAEYGSQFGSVRRNTHYNTSWDEAKFECCMQKWADYSEGDYGVSVLCDNKYGISIHRENISLAVSKSAGFPDPYADRGEQEFTFVICPHEGNEKKQTLKNAYLLTNPLRAFSVDKGGTGKAKSYMFYCDCEHIIIETVKQAEDSNDVILRAYECDNTRGTAGFQKNNGEKLLKAVRCSILEKDKEQLQIGNNFARISYRPYEIITVRMQGGQHESINNV